MACQSIIQWSGLPIFNEAYQSFNGVAWLVACSIKQITAEISSKASSLGNWNWRERIRNAKKRLITTET